MGSKVNDDEMLAVTDVNNSRMYGQGHDSWNASIILK